MKHGYLLSAVTIALPILTGTALWDRSPLAVAWAGLLVGGALVAQAVRSGGLARRLWFLAASPLMALAFLEFGLHAMAPPVVEDNEPDIFLRDEDLGYRLKPGGSGAHTKLVGSEHVFQTEVTIGEDGWRRVTGSEARGGPLRSLDVLGCSFAFGFGLNDDETLPSVLQSRLAAGTLVHNYGVRGWGPHQLLACLESERIKPRAEAPTELVVYWAIADHVLRASGSSAWDRRGPRYEITEGKLRRAGNFNDEENRSRIQRFAWGLRGRSALARRLLKGGNSSASFSERNLNRWSAMVEEIQARVSAWPGQPEFLVVMDGRGPRMKSMAQRLRSLGSSVLDIGPDLQARVEAGGEVYLHALDHHPNAATVELLASKVVDWMGRNL